MAIIFVQEDTAPFCTAAALCSGLGDVQGPIEQFAISGGSAGSSEDGSGNFPNSSSAVRRTLYFDLEIPSGMGGETGDSGNWTVRINHSTGNSSVLGREVHICRVDSGCGNQETLGSLTAQAFDTSTGTWTATVNQASNTSVTAGDRVVIIVGYENTAEHGNSAIGVTPSLNIDCPWTVPAGAGRIMASLASAGGLVSDGGIAGKGGGLAG